MKRLFIFAVVASVFLLAVPAAGSVSAAALPGDMCTVGVSGDAFCAPLKCVGGACQGTLKGGPESASDVYAIFGRVANLFFVFFIALSILLFVWAGFLFVSGGGDPKKIQEAKDRLVWGVIGLFVAMVAAFVPSLVQDLLKVAK
ncbi:MAG: hypothetical protein HYU05_00495 [Candidatus Wildermuthbacteria bacterium]|nr:hypothetical protein [Candidatus Wildermuthbacteria bacterium]